MTQGDFVFAGRGELGPVACDRSIQLKLALADQLQGSDCGKGLGTREQVENGVAVPGLLAVFVGHSSPQVHHCFTADLHTERHAALLRVLEQRRKSVSQRLELKVEIALYLHRLTPLSLFGQLFGGLFQLRHLR